MGEGSGVRGSHEQGDRFLLINHESLSSGLIMYLFLALRLSNFSHALLEYLIIL